MDKETELKNAKRRAVAWLLVAMVIFVAMLFAPRNLWTGALKAMAEAAMVGALADWFAVVALFRHPLGIPIPHTDIIESSKKKIGSNLGNFVTDNFLNASIIRPRLKQFNISARLGQWLLIDKNRSRIAAELIRIAKEALAKLDDADITAIINKQAAALIKKIPTNKLVGEGLTKVVQSNMHQDWISTLTTYLRDFLEQNRELVKEKVKDESHFLIPGFVDSMIAEKITNGGRFSFFEICFRRSFSMANNSGSPAPLACAAAALASSSMAS